MSATPSQSMAYIANLSLSCSKEYGIDANLCFPPSCSVKICLLAGWLIAKHSSNMLVYLRGGSAHTSVRAATLREIYRSYKSNFTVKNRLNKVYRNFLRKGGWGGGGGGGVLCLSVVTVGLYLTVVVCCQIVEDVQAWWILQKGHELNHKAVRVQTHSGQSKMANKDKFLYVNLYVACTNKMFCFFVWLLLFLLCFIFCLIILHKLTLAWYAQLSLTLSLSLSLSLSQNKQNLRKRVNFFWLNERSKTVLIKSNFYSWSQVKMTGVDNSCSSYSSFLSTQIKSDV